MSRFAVATLAACLVAALGTALVRTPARWWVLGGTGAAYAGVTGMGVAFIRMSFFCRARCRGKGLANRLALTFDDGPDPVVTPALLDALKDLKAPATFFCVGAQVKAHPALARRILGEGHGIGNHSYSHAWWTNFLFGRRLRKEILSAQGIIREATGVEARYYRSPMGLTSPHLASALRESGHLLIGWDVRSLDRGAAREQVVNRILRRARDGSIILLHDGGASADVLVGIVRDAVGQLRARGYSFVTLDELLAAN